MDFIIIFFAFAYLTAFSILVGRAWAEAYGEHPHG